MDTHEPKKESFPVPESDTQKVSPEDARKATIREAEHIRDVRARLYARGQTLSRVPHHAVPPQSEHVRVREETIPHPVIETTPEVDTPTTPKETLQSAVLYTATMARRRTFRKTIAYIAVFFFVIATAVASFIMMTGNNNISGDNISLTVTGQSISGAGDTLPFQVTVSNLNAVPIQSATLIVEYPEGTQNPADGKEMITERKQLDSIGNGEIINVELGARVFGAENEEKEIKVSFEYRIAGSNATFNKKAEPFHFKIGTAPIVMTFNALKTISAGQEYVLPLTVQSNTNVLMTDVIIKISYPNGFDFSESTPEPSSGEDVWRIATLKPGEKKVITVKGMMSGKDNEAYKFNATVGIADSVDKNTFTATLAQTQTELSIERPFLDTKITVQGQGGSSVIVGKGSLVDVQMLIENTLDTVIYDGKVSLEIQGTSLNEFSVNALNGFYDSLTNTITWDSTDVAALKEIIPGHPIPLEFSLSLHENITAPTITLIATTQGQRVFEDRVPEVLKGNAKKVVKVAGTASIVARPLTKGPFENTGPMPPIVEQTTLYTLGLTAKAGSNNLTNAEVNAELPQYVKWLNVVTEGDTITYNANTRMIKWTIGTMSANSTQDASFQISFTPSISQVNTTPSLIEDMVFTAIDDFTGIAVKSNAPNATTEHDGVYQSGRVEAP